MILFRPTGLAELLLVHQSGMRAFPPRLPDQPIFYPVLSEAYAAQIARDWNATPGRAGFVLRFLLPDGYASRFPRRVVGSREHQELWVPAEELEQMNARIEGPVELVSAFFGEGFDRGPLPGALVSAASEAG